MTEVKPVCRLKIPFIHIYNSMHVFCMFKLFNNATFGQHETLVLNRLHDSYVIQVCPSYTINMQAYN